MRRSLQEQEETKMLKLLYSRRKCSYIRFNWRELELTKKVKPIVVSMGNYAASGGYYIACNANTILPKITHYRFYRCFGILPNFSELTNKIGIHTQQVKTHENSAP
jgi:protease-4